MRPTFSALLATCLLLAVAPSALANKSSLPSGTPIEFVGTGWTRTITISGTQGCTFELDVTSSDESVATVSWTLDALEKHKVVIEGVGYGAADISIKTVKGSIGACSGFDFDYPVTVLFDEKTFLKQAKGLVKDTVKDAKGVADELFDVYCDDLSVIAAGFADGFIGIEDAYFAAGGLLGSFQDELDLALDDAYEQAWADLWGGDAEFITLDDALIGLMPGGCGLWDDFAALLTKLQRKFETASYKKFKLFTKVLAKAAKGDDAGLLLVAEFPDLLGFLSLDEPILLPGADPEEALPPAPVKPLAKGWSSAGRLSTSETSRLQLGGTADPGAGAVTVAIEGPGGFETSVEATVGEDCQWKADFAGLAPGSYTVTLTQGDNGPISFGKQVP